MFARYLLKHCQDFIYSFSAIAAIGRERKLPADHAFPVLAGAFACETQCESTEGANDERRSENSERARSVAPVQGL
jgi:hypothetical protein